MDFIKLFENGMRMDSLKPKVTQSIFDEQKFSEADFRTETYKRFMENKKKLNDVYQQCVSQYETDKINPNALSTDELTDMLVVLSKQSKELCKIMSNTKMEEKERNHKHIILARMNSFRDILLFRENEMRQEQISGFMKNAQRQRKMQRSHTPKVDYKKQNQMIFEAARADAEKRVKMMFQLPLEEIAELFDVRCDAGPVAPEKEYISWPHVTNTREDNIVPLSPGVKVPKKFNHTTKKLNDYLFTLSGFFKNPAFIDKLQSYYDSLGLEISIKQDRTQKFKGWIKLTVVNFDKTIKFPTNEPKFIEEDQDIPFVNEFNQ